MSSQGFLARWVIGSFIRRIFVIDAGSVIVVVTKLIDRECLLDSLVNLGDA
ncbi:hypothetical protein [Aurantivibrio infirmus]